MRVLEVWLTGGPADGRLIMVAAAADGGFPAELVLDQAGVFAGTDDRPAAAVQHRHRRVDDVDGIPIYEHVPLKS